ncbi:MAG: YhcH/YjgK/YiaL family protein [Planctomycetota bacterium]
MIIGTIENSDIYAVLDEKLERAFRILQDPAITQKDDGRYNVEEDNLYYIVQRYQTKPLKEGKFETHRKYIDVQFVASGKEIVGRAAANSLEIKTPYDQQTDVAFYKTPKEFSRLNLSEGIFCVFYPHDAHMPCCHETSPSDVVKIVVKVRC